MKIELAIVVVLIIVLGYFLLIDKKNEKFRPLVPASVFSQPEAMCGSCPAASGKAPAAKQSYEGMTQTLLQENAEFFDTCKGADTFDKCLDCGQTDMSFASNDYGNPGIDNYNGYVMSQGLDQQVVDNHRNFVKERAYVNSQGAEFTGKTFTPDSGIETDYIKWQGIMLPNASANLMCNPTQVPDIPEEWFQRNNRFCLRT
jgi:hypothetical protein